MLHSHCHIAAATVTIASAAANAEDKAAPSTAARLTLVVFHLLADVLLQLPLQMAVVT
jgi:hypothetical protein